MNSTSSSTAARHAQRKAPPGARLKVATRLLCVYIVCGLLSAAMAYGAGFVHPNAALKFLLVGIIPDLFRATPDALVGWAYVTMFLFAPVTFALCQPQSRPARWFATVAILWWYFWNLTFATIGF